MCTCEHTSRVKVRALSSLVFIIIYARYEKTNYSVFQVQSPLQLQRKAHSKKVGCLFLVVISLGQPTPQDDFCWRITRVCGIQHGPCPLVSRECHALIPSIRDIVPQRLTEAVESAIGKYVSHGRLKLTQIMALLTTEFPGIVTCERQVRNVMSKFQRGPTGYSCRELRQRLML